MSHILPDNESTEIFWHGHTRISLDDIPGILREKIKNLEELEEEEKKHDCVSD